MGSSFGSCFSTGSAAAPTITVGAISDQETLADISLAVTVSGSYTSATWSVYPPSGGDQADTFLDDKTILTPDLTFYNGTAARTFTVNSVKYGPYALGGEWGVKVAVVVSGVTYTSATTTFTLGRDKDGFIKIDPSRTGAASQDGLYTSTVTFTATGATITDDGQATKPSHCSIRCWKSGYTWADEVLVMTHIQLDGAPNADSEVLVCAGLTNTEAPGSGTIALQWGMLRRGINGEADAADATYEAVDVKDNAFTHNIDDDCDGLMHVGFVRAGGLRGSFGTRNDASGWVSNYVRSMATNLNPTDTDEVYHFIGFGRGAASVGSSQAFAVSVYTKDVPTTP